MARGERIPAWRSGRFSTCHFSSLIFRCLQRQTSKHCLESGLVRLARRRTSALSKRPARLAQVPFLNDAGRDALQGKLKNEK